MFVDIWKMYGVNFIGKRSFVGNVECIKIFYFKWENLFVIVFDISFIIGGFVIVICCVIFGKMFF